MYDQDPTDAGDRERVRYYRTRADRRARRAERRAWGCETGWAGSMGLWGGAPRGPSELTLRLRSMMKQVDELDARVSTLETVTARSDAQLAAEINRLARGPAAAAGRQA